jgi:hypothetical protein
LLVVMDERAAREALTQDRTGRTRSCGVGR